MKRKGKGKREEIAEILSRLWDSYLKVVTESREIIFQTISIVCDCIDSDTVGSVRFSCERRSDLDGPKK